MNKSLFRIVRNILLLVLVVFVGYISYLFFNKDLPPIEEIKIAREELTNAKLENAEKYAKIEFDKSTGLYDSAMLYWNNENQKFFLTRNYDQSRKYANESVKYSKKAIEKAGSKSKKLNTEIKSELLVLQSKVKLFQLNFDKLPIDDIKKQSNKGKLLLGEARIAFEHENYAEAKVKLNEAKSLINGSYNKASDRVSNYFSNYNKWKKWADDAKLYSKKNKTYVIVVDKFSKELLLYYNGNISDRYEVELGKNWMCNKIKQGDNATPEGNYKITKKKENGSTKYYKALLLNYPNDDDMKRYQQNKNNGTISKTAKIGGLIEVHGSGGQGANWTEGCIALSNKDMDKLFSKCSVGTPITIVGSLKSLNEVMNNIQND